MEAHLQRIYDYFQIVRCFMRSQSKEKASIKSIVYLSEQPIAYFAELLGYLAKSAFLLGK